MLASKVRWLAPLVISVMTVGAFLPALQNEFVDWDDRENLLENPYYRGLGLPQLRWMFTTFHMGPYQPLSWMTLGLDYLLWGINPFGYHLTNILLHAFNAALFYFVAVRLLSFSSPAAFTAAHPPLRLAAGFAALVFAVHPLRVESVAWATERRDVLSGLFLLSTVLCYLRYAMLPKPATGRWKWMGGALIFYLFSLLSKAMGITLPFVLLVLDVYPLLRLGGKPGQWFSSSSLKVCWEKVPFLVLATPFALLALIGQREVGAYMPLERHGLSLRIAQAFYGIGFYLGKTLLPFGLSPLYELKDVSPLDWPFLLSGFFTVTVTIGLYYFRRRWPAGLASWVYYGVVLAPVLGLAQSGPQLAADRFTYLSCLGWAVLAGAGLFHCWRAYSGGHIRLRTLVIVKVLGIAMVIGLGLLSWQQTRVWRDSETLWRHALAIDPNSSIAHTSLGAVLVGRGELIEAIQHYHKALQIDPAYAEAHYNLGNVLARQGNLKEAIDHYLQAVSINPAYAMAHNNLALALVRTDDLTRAVQHFRKALSINPNHTKARYNLGNVLFRQGNLEEAIEHYRSAVRAQPDFAGAHEALGQALATQGKGDEAIKHFEEAVRIMKSGPGVKEVEPHGPRR